MFLTSVWLNYLQHFTLNQGEILNASNALKLFRLTKMSFKIYIWHMTPLHNKFNGSVISCDGDIICSARSWLWRTKFAIERQLCLNVIENLHQFFFLHCKTLISIKTFLSPETELRKKHFVVSMFRHRYYYWLHSVTKISINLHFLKTTLREAWD